MVIQDMKTLDDALAVIRELTGKLQEFAACNARLEKENAWLKRQIFESRSEKSLAIPEGTEFLPGLEVPDAEEATQEIKQVASHQRKVRKKNGWDEIPDDLPTEEIIIDVPEAEREGMELIGYDESKRIAWRSGLYVKVIKRAKYADKSDALRGVLTAPSAGDYFDTPSGKTKFDVSFTAKVVSDKIENALPLDRQAKIFAREGFPVSPSTLGHLFKNTALALTLLYNRMIEIIMVNEILHVDETFMRLLIPGKGKCPVFFNKTPSMWLGSNTEKKAAIPDAFFKIIIWKTDNKVTHQAYLIPNILIKPKPLKSYQTTVERIQSLTGLKFLTNMSKAQPAK